MAVCPVSKGAIKKGDYNKLKRRVVIKEWKGKVVAQAWPKPRGKPTSALQLAWVQKFTRVNQATKLAEPCSVGIASCLTPNTGWYYRDMLATAMYGKLINDFGEPKIKTPTASVNMASSAVLLANVLTFLEPTVSLWDNNVVWNPTLPRRLTALSAGLYLMSFSVVFAGAIATVGEMRVNIRTNGANVDNQNFRTQQSANGRTVSGHFLVYAHAGDYYEILAQFVPLNCTARICFWQMVAITPENLIP